MSNCRGSEVERQKLKVECPEHREELKRAQDAGTKNRNLGHPAYTPSKEEIFERRFSGNRESEFLYTFLSPGSPGSRKLKVQSREKSTPSVKSENVPSVRSVAPVEQILWIRLSFGFARFKTLKYSRVVAFWGEGLRIFSATLSSPAR
jgi:hypothetical protein